MAVSKTRPIAGKFGRRSVECGIVSPRRAPFARGGAVCSKFATNRAADAIEGAKGASNGKVSLPVEMSFRELWAAVKRKD